MSQKYLLQYHYTYTYKYTIHIEKKRTANGKTAILPVGSNRNRWESANLDSHHSDQPCWQYETWVFGVNFPHGKKQLGTVSDDGLVVASVWKKIYIYIYIYINTFRSPWIGFLIRFWGGGTNPGFSELIFMVLIFMRFAHLPQFFKAFELHLYPITEGGRGEVCWPPLLPAFEPECSKSYVKSKEEARFWVLISHTPITLVVLVVGSDVPTLAKLYLIYIFRYIWL